MHQPSDRVGATDSIFNPLNSVYYEKEYEFC